MRTHRRAGVMGCRADGDDARFAERAPASLRPASWRHGDSRRIQFPAALVAVRLLMLTAGIAALDNGVGRTPAMGWNSWNRFSTHINETLIKQQADALISTGLAAKGYIYVNLDDGWHNWDKGRNNGTMHVDVRKFPSGMKALGDYLHSKGLKFGIYGDSGSRMCGEAFESGSFGHEVDDANLFASWGVDYLKYDNCFIVGENTKESSQHRFGAMRDALLQTGRSIYFSICNWNQFGPANWPGKDFGNSWRTVGDITANFSSVLDCARRNDEYAYRAGPGGWNDPDMLEVGNGDLTMAEDRTHFSLWSIMKSPLLIGTDVATMSKDILDILSNEDVIAVNQDPLGVQGVNRHHDDSSQVWTGPLGGGKFGSGWAALLFNPKTEPQYLTLHWHQLGISEHIPLYAKDLWKGEVSGPHKKVLYAEVQAHDVVMFVLSKDPSVFSSPPQPSPVAPQPTAATPPLNTPSPAAAPASLTNRTVSKRPFRSTYRTVDGYNITMLTKWTPLHSAFRIQYYFTVKKDSAEGALACAPNPYSIINLVTILGPQACPGVLPMESTVLFKRVPNWDATSVFLHFPDGAWKLDDCSSILAFNYHTQSPPRIANVRVELDRVADSDFDEKTFWIKYRGYVASC